ncbi:MAG: peptide chain release factor 2 [bacterium]
MLGGYFEVDSKITKLTELKKESLKEGFWDNVEEANNCFKKISDLEKVINSYLEVELSCEILKEDYSEEDFNFLLKSVSELELETLLNHEYDEFNCYLEIHPGAGGTESCDWSSMLLDMYKFFCDKYNYSYEIINVSKGDEAGIKNALLLIKGSYPYGFLKLESGVHRLVRISPFDSNKRRHTSFASVSVTPELDNSVEIIIKEEELKIDVYRSSGAGGQSVNTTDSAVRITHIPTKTVVTCQNERSQLKNKDTAMKILKSKLYELEIKKNLELENSLKDSSNINFGSQIRSYVLEPYKMVKDHRSNYESFDPEKILNGHIKELLDFNLGSIR